MTKTRPAGKPADTLPKPIKPLRGQRNFGFANAGNHDHQKPLFDDGRDLPGADERDQRIIWDVAHD